MGALIVVGQEILPGGSFLEVEFPRSISFGATGGPSFSTIVNQGFSGQEQRNRNWASSKAKWTIGLKTPAPFGSNRQAFIDLLLAFFLNVGGQASPFRFYDHKDNAFSNTIGIGDGTATRFQLSKSYVMAAQSYVRIITKPVWHTIVDWQGNDLPDSVTVKINGTPTSAWTIDATTGIITFGSAPGASAVVAAAGNFHFPVRFSSDDLPLQIEQSAVHAGEPIASLTGIQLEEVFPPNY